VRDSNGDVFANVYYEQDAARRAAARLPTKDEAHRIALQFTMLLKPLDAGVLVPTQTPPAAMARHFPPPWSVEEQAACFVVRDANKQALGYFYFEDEPGRRSAAKLLTKDEATDRGQRGEVAGVTASKVIWARVPMSAFGGEADIDRTCRHVRL
jgi:hypothetical protein